MKPKGIILLVGILLALMVLLLVKPFTIIGAGQRGVVFDQRSGVSDVIMQEGFNWKLPIIQKVISIDIRTQKEEMQTTASSQDLQDVTATIAINYHLDETKVNRLYQEVGKEYSFVVIDPAIQESTKEITAQFTAEELITKREEVKDKLELVLTEDLAKNGIIVEDIFITNFAFSAQFNVAIEAKVTAEQQALKAQNDLQRVQFEADQKVATAQAEAEAIRIQAQAINSQGGEDYVQLQAIAKWNGVLPTQFVPGSAIPFLNLTK